MKIRLMVVGGEAGRQTNRWQANHRQADHRPTI